jgi:hypothetical protein
MRPPQRRLRAAFSSRAVLFVTIGRCLWSHGHERLELAPQRPGLVRIVFNLWQGV